MRGAARIFAIDMCLGQGHGWTGWRKRGWNRQKKETDPKGDLGGGFKYFLFSTLFGEDFQLG